MSFSGIDLLLSPSAVHEREERLFSVIKIGACAVRRGNYDRLRLRRGVSFKARSRYDGAHPAERASHLLLGDERSILRVNIRMRHSARDGRDESSRITTPMSPFTADSLADSAVRYAHCFPAR